MRVLLPPSESKRPDGGNAIYAPKNLNFHAALGETRERVHTALLAVSADAERAQQVFKLGKKAQQEILHNLRLDTTPGLPAIERYVGVLFDEIGIEDMTHESRAWIDSHVLIQSALFGLVSAADHIPPYRLSASTPLTQELGATLKRTWAAAFDTFAWPGSFILDLRSNDYVALAPLRSGGNWVRLEVVQRTQDGGVKALNHFNKRAKGDLVKRLGATRATVNTFSDLREWAHTVDLEILESDEPHHATLITELTTAG